MARIDRVREEIGWFKLLFGFLFVIYAPLLGWIVENYLVEQNASEHPIFLKIVAITALLAVSTSITIAIFSIRKRLNELEAIEPGESQCNGQKSGR